MDFQSLTALYATKTDDELLHLASEFDQLTIEAQSVLRSEMARRQLEPDEAATALPPAHAAMSVEAPPPRTAPVLPVGDFIADVFRFYHRNCWTYMTLMFPAVAFGTLAILLGKHEVREIERNLPRGPGILQHRLEIAEIGLATWGSFFVSWMASCLSFGAICAVFEQVHAGHLASLKNSISGIRERLGPFLRVSLLLWASFVILVLLAGLSLSMISWVVESRFGRISGSVVYSYSLVAIVALILSRFGLAIPAVVLDDYSAGRAMFRSDELTEGKWRILTALLFKSIVGGYIASMLPFWLASWIPDSINLPWWFSWTLTGASIAAVTAVEPVMFIGFALLYEKTNCRSPRRSG